MREKRERAARRRLPVERDALTGVAIAVFTPLTPPPVLPAVLLHPPRSPREPHHPGCHLRHRPSGPRSSPPSPGTPPATLREHPDRHPRGRVRALQAAVSRSPPAPRDSRGSRRSRAETAWGDAFARYVGGDDEDQPDFPITAHDRNRGQYRPPGSAEHATLGGVQRDAARDKNICQCR